MVGLRACLVALFLLPLQAVAGPWPRETGEVFVSLGARMSSSIAALTGRSRFDPGQYLSAYAEFGVAGARTLVFDAGYDPAGGFKALAVLRLPLGAGTGPWRFALSGGAGAARGGGRGAPVEPLVAVAGSLGRGFQWGEIGGWTTLDVTAMRRVSTGVTTLKADATLGLRPRPRWMTILQLQASHDLGARTYLRLAPSIVREIGPGRHVSLGIDYEVLGPGEVGLSMGSWFTF